MRREKTQSPSKTPGPWAGSVAWSTIDGVSVCSTRKKWDRAKIILTELRLMLGPHSSQEEAAELHRKTLESWRGFMVHLQRTYPAITPYLKGFHLTLDAWRPGRDQDLWKQRLTANTEGYWCDQEMDWIPWEKGDASAPDYVQPVPPLYSDVAALKVLLMPNEPPLRYIHHHRICTIVYGFGDASGTGFGHTIVQVNGVHYSYGLWGSDRQDDSSNYKELSNLVTALEESHAKGLLEGAEVYIFMDNLMAELVFYKGNSSCPKLFKLTLQL